MDASDTLHRVICARGRADEAAGLASELLRSAQEAGITDPDVLGPLHQTFGECKLDTGALDVAELELREAWRLGEEGTVYTGDPCHQRRVALISALARVELAHGRAAEAAKWRARLPEAERTRAGSR